MSEELLKQLETLMRKVVREEVARLLAEDEEEHPEPRIVLVDKKQSIDLDFDYGGKRYRGTVYEVVEQKTCDALQALARKL